MTFIRSLLLLDNSSILGCQVFLTGVIRGFFYRRIDICGRNGEPGAFQESLDGRSNCSGQRIFSGWVVRLGVPPMIFFRRLLPMRLPCAIFFPWFRRKVILGTMNGGIIPVSTLGIF